MIGVVLAGVMFPLWPVKMRIGVWYLSVGVLGLIAAFFGLAIVRLFLWLLTKLLASPGIWLFPNLFADVGFVSQTIFTFSISLFFSFFERVADTYWNLWKQVDSFIPLWSWDVPPPKKSKSSKSKSEKSEKKSSKKSRKDASKKVVTSEGEGEGGEVIDGDLVGPRITEVDDDEEE